MRPISGGVEPAELTQWRHGTPDLGYGDMPSETREAVKSSLLAEQRELCAYTGLRLDAGNSHIEHLIPQCHCESGQDVAYSDMVACYPAPGVRVRFGAVRKADWPSAAELHLFVSPRSEHCESRFSFSLAGKIEASSQEDAAAKETIRRLGLDDRGLEARREGAIRGTLRSCAEERST
jgi:uncharacterized protein (TIGR02646 family)